MKNVNLLLLLISSISIASVSCKKNSAAPSNEPFTKVTFNSTEYNYLGSYDTLGRPNNLLSPDILSSDLLNFIQSSLPEEKDVSKTNPSLLSSNSDLSIKQNSDVFITFVTEGAGHLNSLGFYSYPTTTPPQKSSDIQKITYIFPNASLSGWAGGGLIAGDKVKIGNFNTGTSIGFVLLEGGWDAATKKVNSKVLHFCSNENLNPENDPALKKHTILLNYPKENKIFIGFEDQVRSEPSCDNDFNDVIIYATVNAL